ncbi:aminotransferase class I/II-fold pyridoxal phosphate-dependent enzyme [Glutamicibacter sp.]|uniref:pyridoxal phosphate-dependent aminotransferase n=1 Tax=Glutamicibacter sp. TaxID=1931995 RepID=UPI0028BE6E7C|nr:aminotransferase class I/II-fold pyridoxal phosphate-dependent enzyme [Glutamicibacter sp.]
MKVSQRGQVPPFEVMQIVEEVARLRAAGHDVISLCVGEPGGGAPSAVNELASRLHGEDADFGYTATAGLQATREALAAHYSRTYGVEVPAKNFVMTTGSSGAFQLAFLAAFDAGDKVALARPGYPAYANILGALGLEVIDIPTGPAQRFQPSVELLEQAWAEHGRFEGLIIASPNNPTGTMFSARELEELSSWCVKHQVRMISDEIYHGIEFVPDRRGHTSWEFTDSSIVVSSFSKYWGMTGWRLGWMIVPDQLLPTVDALASNLALCAPAPAQRAVIAAFEPQSIAEAQRRVEEFARTRELVLAHLDKLGIEQAAPADGAFYLYGKLSEPLLEHFGSAGQFCRAVLDTAFVALTPGGDFDPFEGQHFIRLSFAAGYDRVAQALDRVDTVIRRSLPIS